MKKTLLKHYVLILLLTLLSPLYSLAASVNYAITTTLSSWTTPGGATGTTFKAGQKITMVITVSNVSGTPTFSPAIRFVAPASVVGVSWTAQRGLGNSFANGSTQSASGTGNINSTSAVLPAGSSLIYTVIMYARRDFSGTTTFTATISAGGTDTDPTTTNNSATANTNISVGSPFITGISPLSGAVGTAVTISGYNLSGAKTVFFGNVKGTITATGSNSVIATVPAGGTYNTIAVSDGKSSAKSFDFFDVTAPGSSSNYRTRQDIVAGASPTSVATGDIDGDGKPDMVVANSGANTLSVYRNISTTADGVKFAAPVDVATVGSPKLIKIGDLNEDGKPDLVLSYTGTSATTITIFENTSTSGSISFNTAVNLIGGSSSKNLFIADIDGDGRQDIINDVNSTPSPFPLQVLYNDTPFGQVQLSASNFKIARASLAPGALASPPTNFVIADINKDGLPDVQFIYNSNALLAGDHNYSTFYNNKLAFSYDDPSVRDRDYQVPTQASPLNIAVGDIDGDGIADIVVTYANSSTVSVFRLESASGGLIYGYGGINFNTGVNGGNIAVTDLDGDGKPDLAISGTDPNPMVSTLINQSSPGNVSFGSAVNLITPSGTSAIDAADFDLDGKTDLVAVNTNSNSISLFSTLKSASVITFTPTLLKTNGDADYTPGATSTNTVIPITYTSDNAAVATIVNGNVHITGVGVANIKASQGASADYIAAPDAVQVLTVAPSANAALNNFNITAGTLSPAFTNGITDYTALVSNTTASIAITPMVNQANATVKVNGATVNSGSASAAVSLNIGSNTIKIVVTAQDGITVQTYTLTVTRAASTDAALSNLTTSAGAISPAFSPATNTYTISVGNAVNTITLTPTANDANASITVNGIAVNSNTESQAIALSAGNNTITTVVTAQDGVTTKTYTLVVNKTATSTDATLSSLANTAEAALSPIFSPDVTSYQISVSNNTTSIAFTPTVNQANAVVKVNGTIVSSGNASQQIALNVGSNTINVLVIAQDGTTTKTYTLTATRSASTEAAVSAYSVSAGTLSPAFSPTTTAYTVSVPYSQTSIVITPQSAANSTTTVNGITVANGASSAPIVLNIGNNTITTVVTAQDGTTKQTYTLTAIRLKNDATLSFPAISAHTYGDSDFALVATSTNNGIPITYTSDNTAIATITGSNIHILKAGTVNITASQTGNTDYNPANSVSQSFTVGKAAITIAAAAQSKIYGTPDPAFTYTITGGALVGTDAFIGSLSREAGENTGVYAIKQGTLALNNNYTLNYTSDNLTISKATITGVTLADNTTTYDGTAKSLAVAGLPAGATVVYTGNGQTNAGTYPVTAIVSQANYNDLSLSAQLIISKDTITGVTLVDNTTTYDGTAKSLAVAGLPAGATVVYTGNGQTNAGTYPVNVTVSQVNYNDLALSAQLTISKATIKGVTLVDNTTTYDGTAKSIAVAGLPAGSTVVYTGNGQTNAGAYPVTATVSQANYNDLSLSAQLIISKATITGVILADNTTTYDGTAKSIVVSGLPAGATVVYTGNGQTNAGTYPVTATVSQTNYNDLPLSAQLTISKATIIGVTLADNTTTYDGTANSLAVAGLPAGATVVYTGNGQTNAGTYPVTATVSQANYNDLSLSAQLIISKATVTGVTLADNTTTYDGTAKSLNVMGLPVGATVSYIGNGQTNAGIYPVTATISQANYNDLSLSAQLTISKATITGVTLADNTTTFDGTAKSLNVSGLPAGASVVYTGNGQTNAGTYPVTATISQTNYNDLALSAQLTISKATITGVTLADSTTTYDGTAKSLSVAGLPAGATIVYTGNGQTNAGNYPVTATVSQANYNDLPLSAQLTINKATITGVTLEDNTTTYDGTAKSLAVAGLPAGATVSYTGNGQTNAGTYPVTATVSQTNYNDLSLSAELTISKATITGVTLADNTTTYDGTSKSLNVVGIPAGATVSYTGNGQTNAGTYPVTATVSQTNYNDLSLSAQLTISKATITGVTLADNTTTYDGTAKSIAVAGLPAGATVVYTGNGQTKAGTYPVTATISQTNYNDFALSAQLTISKATITGVTLADNTTTYDGTAKSLSVAGLPAGATVVYTGNGQTNAGIYPVTATVSQANYNDLPLSAQLTINKATITGVTLADNTTTYDGTTKSLVVSGLPAGATVSYTGNGQTNAGIYSVTATVSQTNYNDLVLSAQLTISKATITGVTLADNTTTFDGNAKSLNVMGLPVGATVSYTGNGQINTGVYTINAKISKVNYNDLLLSAQLTINSAVITGVTFADATVSYSGITKSLAVAGLPVAATVVYSNNSQVNAGVYTVTAKVSRIGYTDLMLTAKLTINKVALNITADNKAKIYGDSNPLLTLVYNGFVNNESSANLTTQPTVYTSATQATGVGLYPISVNGGASDNYNLVYTAGTLTINKAPLTIKANDQTKTFATNNPALTVSYTGFVNNDTNISLNTQPAVSTTATLLSLAGTYPITVGGAASNNYAITYINGTLTVTTNVLTITVDIKNKIYGSSNPTLTVSYSGFINGDTPAKLTKQPTITTTATTASAAGVYPITASGAVIPNYTIVYVQGSLIVNKANLIVMADNKSRNYGEDNPAFTINYSGFVNGDNVSKLSNVATATTTAVTNSAPGIYAIVPSGASAANYTFTYVNGALSIVPLSNALLSGLTLSSGTLLPGFSPYFFFYATLVANDIDHINITPTADPTATIKVNGIACSNGRASNSINLNYGENLIKVEVTAQNGYNKLVYLVSVVRELHTPVACNVMSPNGDGHNDRWVIKDIEWFPNNTITICDGGGKVIYTKRGYNNDWDGTQGGRPVVQGTYYYTLDCGPGQRTVKGFITVLKQ